MKWYNQLFSNSTADAKVHNCMLSSERIKLVPIDESYLSFLLDLRWNKNICETIIFEPITKEQQLNWYKNLKNAQMFCICLKDGTPIGAIGAFEIHSIHRRCKWTLRIHPDHWRKGYAAEAVKIFLDYIFNTLNINKLMGDCFSDNIAEVNNLRKLGFKEEGLWKEHYFHKGKYRDAIQFVMLKRDYDKIINSL